MKFLGIITARGGSKGVPRKNITDLGGRPVLYYSIESALESKLDEVILSTEDEEIADIGKSYGVKVPFMRPVELAKDDTPHIPVLQYTLERYEKIIGQRFDYILTIQPTSPFRSADDINIAIDIAKNKRPDCVVSLERFTDLSIEKLKYLDDDGSVVSAFSDEKKLEGLARQKRKPLYRRNGAIYLTRRDVLLNGSVYGDNVLGFEMPAERSVDINGKIDLEFAEFLIKRGS